MKLKEVKMSHFSDTIFKRTYAFTPSEDWYGCAARVAKFVANGDAGLEKEFFDVISTKKFMPGGRYLYSSGREIPAINNCFLLKAEDSREGWGKLLSYHAQALSTGGGVGTYYGDIREKGKPIKRYGGVASGPISLMAMVNEVARHIIAGGKRRSALLASLPWNHPDIEQFIHAKDWETVIRAMKEKDFNFPAILDYTNISVCLDDNFFKSIKRNKETQDFFYRVCKQMCITGEPGFLVNLGKQSNEVCRNPCGEAVSSDSGDICNLGSINLARIENLGELERVTRIAIRFLYSGTFIGWVPHQDFELVRDRNRRIGLGFMGLHEFCIKNNQKYEPSILLKRWLSTWQETSDDEADIIAKKIGSNRSISIRALAPNGTISIIAETTSGIEPIFCVAYKRRFLGTNGKWQYSYVIDPTAERLIQEGVRSDTIEDAYSLAKDVERRIAMQAFIQEYTDQAISSTVNLPEYGESGNNNVKKFSKILLKYLPRLRGFTAYPDNSRAGQPLTSISYQTAKKHMDVIYQEDADKCSGGVCGV